MRGRKSIPSSRNGWRSTIRLWSRRGRTVEIALCFQEGGLSDLRTGDPSREIVGADMNASIDSRLASLVGGVKIGGPLKMNVFARTLFEFEEGILRRDELSQATREKLAPGERRQHLGRRPAEGAVPRIITRKGGRHEGVELIRHPFLGADPADSAKTIHFVGRLTRPGLNGHLAHAGDLD